MIKPFLLKLTLLISTINLQAGPRQIVTQTIAKATVSVASALETKWTNLMTQAFTEPTPGRIMQYANQFAVCNNGVPPCSTSGHCTCRHLKNNLSPEEIIAAHKYLELVTRK